MEYLWAKYEGSHFLDHVPPLTRSRKKGALKFYRTSLSNVAERVILNPLPLANRSLRWRDAKQIQFWFTTLVWLVMNKGHSILCQKFLSRFLSGGELFFAGCAFLFVSFRPLPDCEEFWDVMSPRACFARLLTAVLASSPSRTSWAT